ncbi:hypothetical protein [Rubrolithibacter danxiaensis]|uniref:hypothetical protein n=1 Tax=Rubrolithibacter danxiaensis TaxID=3390805 RepID=UPI003BF87B56
MLRKIGIGHIEKTASAIWTDYNVHDPGITTLEFLCYAITDLSFRSTFSIPDLLATETDTVKNIHEHFLSAEKIFPNKPVTVNDYRKLLIDIEGIKNAWISKADINIFADLIEKKLQHQPQSHRWEQVAVKGFYDVLIEFDEDVLPENKEALKAEARKILMANRNLCEDFSGINEINNQEFRLCGEFEISPGADEVETLAAVFFNIQSYLNPLVKFYGLQQLLDEKYQPDKIFEGPLLNHGFIKEEELINAGLKSELRLSDIMQQVLQVNGILAITDIIFSPVSQSTLPTSKWIVAVENSCQPKISVSSSNVLVYKNGMPIRVPMDKVKLRFDELMAQYIIGNEHVVTANLDFEIGAYRNIRDYYSIQNHFPKNYGISHWGLPDDAPAERKMQARQLQGYLYFFDQQLANYLAQLANIRSLFSLDDEKQTYFTQLAAGFKESKNLFVDFDPITNSLDKVKQKVQLAAEQPGSAAFFERRNLFLDHLLSRFAESFFDYVSVLNSLFPVNQQEIVDVKTAFLKHYPEYSSRRFTGPDYSQPMNGAISGLQMRLERLLGLKEDMFLVEHTLLLPQQPIPQSPPLSPPQPEEDKGFMPVCIDENCGDCNSLDPYSFRLSIVLPAYSTRFLNMDFRRYCERIIRMETPAHLFPKICWVNNEQLQQFKTAYSKWLEVKAGTIADTDKKILEDFISILTTLKNVYPPARLEDCKSNQERKFFLLNQNVLGTLKT